MAFSFNVPEWLSQYPARRWAILVYILLLLNCIHAFLGGQDIRSHQQPLEGSQPFVLLHEDLDHDSSGLPFPNKQVITTQQTQFSPPQGQAIHPELPANPLGELHNALETMQDKYFEAWIGKWPSAIDWTSAVIGTYLSGSLISLSRSLEYTLPGTLLTLDATSEEGERIENEINKYFSQSTAYYFGQDHLSIRMQAYDDMLWVVLGWLESVKFTNLHNDLHYAPSRHSVEHAQWHGKQWEPAFAHRARVFYNLASKGWDTKLCGGGMTWNPRLTPYKNAITNELFISASIGMYLYFPGDSNTSPFVYSNEDYKALSPEKRFDPKYLKAAVKAYDWLSKSNMTNEKGLYVDGFHVRGWGRNGTIGTGQCDVRNEMVYTYNQGVILSGLRGLWEGTGRRAYLEDGHRLVRNVIRATGWELRSRKDRKRWAGLGRSGILEETCDSQGTCSQNGQTFKGIFFHHLTLFCEPLPAEPVVPGKTFGASTVDAMLHAQSCKEYATWVAHNARAALGTRDKDGKFGMWWGESSIPADDMDTLLPQGAIDYWNSDSLSRDSRRKLPGDNIFNTYRPAPVRRRNHQRPEPQAHQDNLQVDDDEADQDISFLSVASLVREEKDPNDRGRGRTVETQGGGVAVLRAMWEFVNLYSHE